MFSIHSSLTDTLKMPLRRYQTPFRFINAFANFFGKIDNMLSFIEIILGSLCVVCTFNSFTSSRTSQGFSYWAAPMSDIMFFASSFAFMIITMLRMCSSYNIQHSFYLKRTLLVSRKQKP